MLWLLCSRLGDNANGSYDQLPGLERTALEDPEFRMGCGILEADIDVDAFNGMSGTWVTYPLMKECKASDILREGCLALEAFAFVNADGQLTLARLGDSRDTPVITLTSAYTMPDEQAKVYVDEESIHPVVKWRANFDPVENDFDLEHITIDAELLQRYPNKDDPFEIESRGIGVDVPVQLRDKQRLARGFPMSLSMLDQKARSFQVRGGRGRLIVERTFRLAAVAARVGDVVSIGFEGPDLEGGSINGRLARVVGRRPRWRSNAVDLVLEVFEAVYRVAPSSIIAAVSTTDSANDTIELSTSDPDHASTSPQDDFHVGQLVRIWDMSAAAYEDAEIASILSGPPRLVFTGSLALTVETGRDWVTWGPLGTSDGTTANGDDESDWLYQMANDGVAAEGATRRWQ
jgi:hypothetical protein